MELASNDEVGTWQDPRDPTAAAATTTASDLASDTTEPPDTTYTRTTHTVTTTMPNGRKNLAGPKDLTSERQSSSTELETSRVKISAFSPLSARFSPPVLVQVPTSSTGRLGFALEPRLTTASRATRSDAAREAPAVSDSSASLSHWSTPAGSAWSLRSRCCASE